jgi:hypothetical protein
VHRGLDRENVRRMDAGRRLRDSGHTLLTSPLAGHVHGEVRVHVTNHNHSQPAPQS